MDGMNGSCGSIPKKKRRFGNRPCAVLPTSTSRMGMDKNGMECGQRDNDGEDGEDVGDGDKPRLLRRGTVDFSVLDEATLERYARVYDVRGGKEDLGKMEEKTEGKRETMKEKKNEEEEGGKAKSLETRKRERTDENECEERESKRSREETPESEGKDDETQGSGSESDKKAELAESVSKHFESTPLPRGELQTLLEFIEAVRRVH